MSSRGRSRAVKAPASVVSSASASEANTVVESVPQSVPQSVPESVPESVPSTQGTPTFGKSDSDWDIAAPASAAASAAESVTESVAESTESVAESDPDVLKEYKSFDEMELPEELLRGVYASGFERPSDIQTKAIIPMKEGRDVLAQAPSGTGKTAMFLIGGFTRINVALNEVQMVVISPTRELADQTGNVAKALGTFMGLRYHLATGGVGVDTDLEKLGRGSTAIPHLLVVTPGRFYDLLTRKAVKPATIRVLVLDEADQLLDAKFKEQIQTIMSEPFIWPASTQVALVSATMIPAIAATAKTLLVRNPVTILREADEVSLEGIRQFCIKLDREDQKLMTLCDLSDHLTIKQCTIFVNTRAKAEWLMEQMRRQGFDLDCIHGDMDLKERKRRMDSFRAGKIRVLIATDLLARGIDVQQISLVINYELPVSRENYIHRIGRSGRFGRKGASINLLDAREVRIQAEIEEFYGKKVEDLPMDLNIY